MAAIFAQRLLAGEPAKVLGDGGNVHGYVYVDDVMDASYRASGEVGDGVCFNTSTDMGTSDRQSYSLVAQATDIKDSLESAPLRTDDVARSASDPTRAREVLG